MQTTENTRDNPVTPDLRPGLSTKQLAGQIGIGENSLRQEYSRSGSYFGVVPKKLPNRFLRWPADSLERLLKDDK